MDPQSPTFGQELWSIASSGEIANFIVIFGAIFSVLIGIFKIPKLVSKINAIPKIQHKLDTLIEFLGENKLINASQATKLFTAQSPINITDDGEHILKKSGLSELIEKNKEFLIKKVEDEKPQDAYGIQQESFALAIGLLDLSEIVSEEDAKLVRKTAFDCGMKVSEILMAAGILIRNAVLEKNGIPYSHIDACDPKNKKSKK